MNGRSLRRLGVRVGCSVIAVGVALALAGCTPPIHGAVGITVTLDGEIHALLEPCGNLLAGALLQINDAQGLDTGEHVRWTIADNDSSSGDAAAIVIPPLDETVVYELSAWADPPVDGYFSATNYLQSVQFTVADLAGLPVGTVRWQYWWGREAVTEGTPEQFHEAACDPSFPTSTLAPTP